MSTPAPKAGAGLVEALAEALLTHEWSDRAMSAHARHRFSGDCEVCRCDVAAMAPVLARVVQAHVDAAVAAALQSAAAVIERELNCGCVEEFDTTWLQTGSHISCPTAHRAALIVREQIPAEGER